MSGMVWINDRDVSELGVTIAQDPSGPRDAPIVNPPGQPILGRLGQIETSSRPSGEPRRITISGVQKAANREALMTLLDGLKLLCGSGMVRLRLGDTPDREWEVVCQVRAGTIGDWMNQPAHSITLVCTALDPVAESVVPSHVDFRSGATQCPLGSAISLPLIRVGGITNPVITLKDYLGRTVGTLGLTASLTSSQWLEIDCEQKTIINHAGIAQAPVLTSGDFLELDPSHGATLAGPYPNLECSGSPSIAEAIYRRRWL